jgi:hypothetical protein
MRRSLVGLLLIAVVMAWCLPVFSQEKLDDKTAVVKKEEKKEEKKDEKKDDPSKLFVDLSGVMYLEWVYNSGFKYNGSSKWNKVYRYGINTDKYFTTGLPADLSAVQPVNYSKKNNSTVRLQRVYITLKKDLGDYFSVKVTTDIAPTGQDFIYLKYGFVQFFKEWGTQIGPVSVKAQLGKIATPVIGITDNLSDLRWLGPNYLNNSKLMLNGNSFDDSADLGGEVALSLFKLATLEYTITNGEGYKSDDNEVYGGKAHTLLVSANPVDYIKELYVNFYGRWEDTQKNLIDTAPYYLKTPKYPIKYSGVDDRIYYGCGVAWKSDLIKLGVNFFAPEKHYSKTVFANATPAVFDGYSAGYRMKFLLVDSWFNFNLGAITPAGILLMGRCSWGREMKSLLGNGRQQRETLLLGGGLGYQFNKYFRMVLYYEGIRYSLMTKLHYFSQKDPAPNNNVYVKLEAKY